MVAKVSEVEQVGVWLCGTGFEAARSPICLDGAFRWILYLHALSAFVGAEQQGCTRSSLSCCIDS